MTQNSNQTSPQELVVEETRTSSSTTDSIGDSENNKTITLEGTSTEVSQRQKMEEQLENATVFQEAKPTEIFGEGTVFQGIGFDPKFEYFTSSPKKVNLTWRHIGLKIRRKEILKGITGHVSSGSVCALMGPSGAGKSSLLNVLAGRVLPSRKKKISGDMLVNGKKVNPVEYRKNIAYVMQEDLLYATATAREALEFSARLRLPVEISR